MGLIKMFALAVFVTAVAIAVVGVSSASAQSTALCKANESPCSEKNMFPAGAKILLSYVEGFFETSLGIIECETAHAEGKTTNKLGSPIAIEMESAAVAGCEGCSVTISTFGTLLLLKTAANLANVTVHGVLAKASCMGILNCTYVSGEAEMHASGLNGGTPAMLTASEMEVEKESGFLCPATAMKSALVNLTANGENFYISS